MKDFPLEKKYKKLQEVLQKYQHVVVAFSGGVDSSFLLHAASEVLPKGRVTAFFADSYLVPNPARENAYKIFEKHFKDAVDLKPIEIDPFAWQDFLANPPERCYLCKKRIYSIFLMEMQNIDKASLADGTNSDDLLMNRPGYRAVLELGVLTPLAQAGLKKSDIRNLAERAGLENYNLPSNSCLATRIETATPLSAGILDMVDKAERFLLEKGFLRCRVRPLAKYTVIEIRENDLEKIVLPKIRTDIYNYFRSLGLELPVLDLTGRHERLPKKNRRVKNTDINS